MRGAAGFSKNVRFECEATWRNTDWHEVRAIHAIMRGDFEYAKPIDFGQADRHLHGYVVPSSARFDVRHTEQITTSFPNRSPVASYDRP